MGISQGGEKVMNETPSVKALRAFSCITRPQTELQAGGCELPQVCSLQRCEPLSLFSGAQ